MIIRASDRQELCQQIREANARRSFVARVDLEAMSRVVEHTPEDMTVTVEAGLTLANLQQALSKHRQWLPLDPPHTESLTIAELVSRNVSGPRRFGFGTVRDHLLGLQVVLADGRLVQSGGKVVKNVAGFDLLKVFIGGHDSLGVITEATFKLLPVPEAERLVLCRCNSIDEACRAVEAILESPAAPSVLDMHNLEPRGGLVVIAGFSGATEDVAWQLDCARAIGFAEEATLDYVATFWSDARQPGRTSVLPSELGLALCELGTAPFVARAGNGVIYHRGSPDSKATPGNVELSRRLKAAFDPYGIFPPMP